MNSVEAFDHIEKEHLHHAYVVEAPQDEGFAVLKALMERFAIPTKGNPDFHEYVFDNFLLVHAHALRREQSMRGAEGAKKIFLVAFNTILHEAQNALLKTLEEPTEGTHFFFVTRTSEVLLPTLRSRMQVIRSASSVISHLPVRDTQTGQLSEKNAGEQFLAATISERLKMIERFTKVKADEKGEAKESARVFLESLERALYKNLTTYGLAAIADKPYVRSSQYVPAVEHVLTAKRYLSERSPSVKLLLEHLALTIPQARE